MLSRLSCLNFDPALGHTPRDDVVREIRRTGDPPWQAGSLFLYNATSSAGAAMWETNAKDNPDQPLPTAQTSRKKVDSTDLIGRILAVVLITVWVSSPYWIPRVYNSAKRTLDNSGWIEHSHDTPIWIGGEWLTGEYRICEMPGYLWGRLPDSAHLLCSSGDPRAIEGIWPAEFRTSLSTEESNQVASGSWEGLERHFHILPVKYWGRIDRRDRTGFSWRCQKEASGLECKALN